MRHFRQLYKCTHCGYQFRTTNRISLDELWERYLEHKQTISELAAYYQVSASTIKRRLSECSKFGNSRFWSKQDLCISMLRIGDAVQVFS
ncbi:hypothetical protein [Porphyromonas gingivalis]|uniref:hypothetical protein n=1 Tax=Porphyromonas gingivalis TaxID=837 RepID=UPI003D15FC60